MKLRASCSAPATTLHPNPGGCSWVPHAAPDWGQITFSTLGTWEVDEDSRDVTSDKCLPLPPPRGRPHPKTEACQTPACPPFSSLTFLAMLQPDPQVPSYGQS